MGLEGLLGLLLVHLFEFAIIDDRVEVGYES